MNIIDSNNFNTIFENILIAKGGENVVKGRYDIEPIPLEKKSGFIIQLLQSLREIKSITYKMLFWEKDELIKDFLNSNLQDKDYKIAINYSGTEIPGVVFVDDKEFDYVLMKTILDTHFNYELGVLPSLNLRVQICVNNVYDFIYLLDVYDDRGFDIYHLLKSKNDI